MRDRALAFDEEQLSPTLVPLDDEALGRAGDEVRDHGVDGDPPAGDRDPGLAGGDEAGCEPTRGRGPVELERDGHLPDRAVRADREHVLRRLLEVGTRGHVEVGGRSTEIAELDAVTNGELAQFLVAAQELVQPVLHVQSARDGLLEQRAPGGRKASTGRGDSDESRVRAVPERVLDGADDRNTALRLARAGRVEDRDDRPLAVVEHAARRLPVVGVAGVALGEDQQALRLLRHRAPVSRTAPERRR